MNLHKASVCSTRGMSEVVESHGMLVQAPGMQERGLSKGFSLVRLPTFQKEKQKERVRCIVAFFVDSLFLFVFFVCLFRFSRKSNRCNVAFTHAKLWTCHFGCGHSEDFSCFMVLNGAEIFMLAVLLWCFIMGDQQCGPPQVMMPPLKDTNRI